MTSAPPLLLTVRRFAQRHPAFTQGALRWMIFRARSPIATEREAALNAAIVRLGRRVYIDEEKFFAWVGEQGASR